MRTVTFADPVLIDYLKRHFVLVWHNQAPEVPPSAFTAREAPGNYPEGSGGGNLRTYFCTADGAICYYLEGYWGPERFLTQAQHGHDLVRKLTPLPASERLTQAGHELTRHLWEFGQARRRLRGQHGARFATGSPATLEDAA